MLLRSWHPRAFVAGVCLLVAAACGGSASNPIDRFAELQRVGSAANFAVTYAISEPDASSSLGVMTWRQDEDGSSRVDIESEDATGSRTDTWIHAFGKDVVCSNRFPGVVGMHCVSGSHDNLAAMESFQGMNDVVLPDSNLATDGRETFADENAECFRHVAVRQRTSYESRICYTARGALMYADGPASLSMFFMVNEHFKAYGLPGNAILSNRSAVLRATSVRYEVGAEEFNPPAAAKESSAR